MILARFCFNAELLFVRHQGKDAAEEKHSQQTTSLIKTKRFTGGDIFSTVDNHLNKTNALWKNCVRKNTEGAAALTTKRFQGKVTGIAQHKKFITASLTGKIL